MGCEVMGLGDLERSGERNARSIHVDIQRERERERESV